MGCKFYNIYSLGEKIINSHQHELKQRNFHDKRLLLNWKYIFGNKSDEMQPCKITFNGIDENGLTKKILYISTKNRQFASEFMFHKKQLLTDLNQYFGTEKSFFKDIKLNIINNSK